jgi:thymidylate kinase
MPSRGSIWTKSCDCKRADGASNMPSVALIGPDGAGKTTVARMLEETSSLPVKYMYMGINIEASNYALLTSRFIEHLRNRQNSHPIQPQTDDRLVQPTENGKRLFSGKLWALGRLANRLADEWYRQLMSWYYQTRGYVVIYDRHFLFDFSLDHIGNHAPYFDDRLHRWFLTHLYPTPGLIIYLDVPAAELFARKGEKGTAELERRRQAFLRLKRQFSNFRSIDASQPLSKVHSDVSDCIAQFFRSAKRAPILGHTLRSHSQSSRES